MCEKGNIDGQCPSCDARKESEEEGFIAFDERHSVWSCVYCQSEVEADNETDGDCHYLKKKSKAYYVDLYGCLDYEQADSCNSGDDFSDEEQDSEDEIIIDDDDIPPESDSIAATAVTTLPLSTIISTIVPPNTA